MPILLDTGIIYAYYDRRDSWHRQAVDVIQQEGNQLIVPGPVIPEVDYLLEKRLGQRAQELLYQSLAEGDYLVAELPRDKYRRILDLNRRFADLNLGFVDAAVLALAENLPVKRIATTDRRHFGALASELSLILLP